LRAAEAEVEAREAETAKLPPRPFSTGVFRFLLDPNAISRWLLMSLGLQIEVGAIQSAIRLSSSAGLEQIFGVFLSVFSCIFGVLLASWMGATLLVVLQDSSQGKGVMENWPGINIIDWFFDSWPLLASSFLALAPGLAVGQMAYFASGDMLWFWRFGLGVGGVSLALALPILTLSFTENGSPYSPSVWKSLRVAGRYWRAFYQRSCLLVIFLAGIAYLRWNSISLISNLLLSAGGMLVVLLYFRLLGRLSWCCGEALGASEQEPT
jgi:hypothetical protein